MTQIVKYKIPTMDELITKSETDLKLDKLTVLLNQEPPKAWISEHPIIKIKKIVSGQETSVPLPYLSIDKIEYLFARIYGGYSTRINDVKVIANSVCVTVTVSVTNPITGLTEAHDGIGAAPIQTDSGKGAMDWNFAKSSGVQIAAPAAETYAIKDAAEKFGKIFGKDLSRRDTLNYDSILKEASKNDEISEDIKTQISNCTNDDDINILMDSYPELSKNTNFLNLIKTQKLSWKN